NILLGRFNLIPGFQPTARPAPVAQAVALRRSFVALHRMERRIRPPSSGNPGIRLNSPRRMLIGPSHANKVVTGPNRLTVADASESGAPDLAIRKAAIGNKIRPRKMLGLRTPTAIRNTISGFGGSGPHSD